MIVDYIVYHDDTTKSPCVSAPNLDGFGAGVRDNEEGVLLEKHNLGGSGFRVADHPALHRFA